MWPFSQSFNYAGDFDAGDDRKLRGDRIPVLADECLEEIDAGGSDPDQDLTRFRDWHWEFN
jgi:hypothetical protein